MDDNLLVENFKRYEQLLYGIATGFGFTYGESLALVKQVMADGVEQCRTTEPCKSYRIFLSKMMVRRCVLKVSSDIFAFNPGGGSKYSWTDSGLHTRLSINDLPLTTRSVFILQEKIGFSEQEVSEILNTSAYNVRARFNKALSFLKSYRY
jgi:hypothetical protein